MKTLIAILLLFPLSQAVHSQGRGNTWCFGDSCLINFNTVPPTTGASIMRTRGTACSISDSSGNLLFYAGSPHVDLWQSGGTTFVGVVYNKNHQIMDNGDTLGSELSYNEMIIVPDPNFNERYYLFHLQLMTVNTGLNYSVIDLSYHSGLGKVTSKNNQLLSGYMADGINAVKHGNGRDWWVIARRSNYLSGGPADNLFYVFLVDTAGISSLPVQSVGTLNPTNSAKITFNPDGNKFVFTNLNDLIELYDFDRCTGVISNPVTIQPNAAPGGSNYLWGAEFSTSGRYFYISTSLDSSSLYQFDTHAANINSSRLLIGNSTQIYNGGGALKRGPDNKIYYAFAWNDGVNFNFPYPDSEYNMYNMNLGVIHQPDSPGVACDFRPFSFYLGGKRNYWGLPNNPNYDLPQLYGSSCDTLGVQVQEITRGQKHFFVFPNPSSGTINFQSEKITKGEIRIYDLLGNLILVKSLSNGHAAIADLKAGSYAVQFIENGHIVSREKFVVVK